MTALVGIIVAVILVIGVCWWWFGTDKNQNSLPMPILGKNANFLSTTKLLGVLMHLSKKHDGVVKLRLGPFLRFVIVSDYDLLKNILSNTELITKSTSYDYLRPWLGSGLLTSDGSTWKKHRRILTPAFHFQILEQFVEVFEACGQKLVEKLQKEVGKKSVDIYPFVTLCTLDIICESIMGISINAQDGENSIYVSSVKEMCRIVIERTLSPLQMINFLFPLHKNYYTQKKALKILHEQTNSVINKRRQELEAKADDGTETKNKKLFLDLLLQASIDGQPLTQEQIREEVDTFMFEGHDTTASAISFALFCLANNKSAQDKAFEEQKTLFGKEPIVAYSDLQNMKYLELVIKETLRLYPSVPLFGREVIKTPVDSTDFSKGDTIIIFAYGIHRNPKYFENPGDFKPERFENIDGTLPYAYIPFSAGPRNCIGQKYAILEMKSTLAKIIRKFELEPAEPLHKIKLAAESVLKSANGIKISLKLRN